MERREGLEEDAAGSWEAFALAAIAPLGPFTQVHLAPKLPPALLNAALVTYLTLQADELLLALIDGGARTPDGCCALTTRRIYWVERDDGEDTGPGASGVVRRAGPAVAAWLATPPIMGCCRQRSRNRVSGTDRSVSIWGVGGPWCSNAPTPGWRGPWRGIWKRWAPRLAPASHPPLSRVRPATGGPHSRALPAVAKVTARARTLTADLLEFRTALDCGDAASWS